MIIVYALLFVMAWMVCAAAAFAFMDIRTHGEFKRWYLSAPLSFLRAFCWVAWPYLLVRHLRGR
jgi:hypothetical protein